MGHTTYLRERRIKLFNRDPHCHWCGREVVLTERHRSRLPLNAATIDHLNAKNTKNGKRIREPGKVVTVLACSECNNKRSLNQRRTFPKFDLWYKSGSFPYPFRWVGRTLKALRKYKGRFK